MEPTRASPLRTWLLLGAAVAVPLYVLPFGIWGLRALRPRFLRDAAGGAVALGMVSLLGLGVRGAAWWKAGHPFRPPPSGPDHWKLPRTEPLVPEGVTASAVSGY
ncbi:MAG: hypothetical protein L0Y66_24715 [Myxococcaceae bacterium]|nr:hypothetical protein [Myxococcaceae bacterium]MCI0670587.1 hypothetical protein [Myxococcaceae bacterium]